MSNYIGQRLSLKGQVCTIRYVGAVQDKPGEWLGVEWDDSTRGKHDGTHAGVKYFECRNPSPTAASFLKPKQTWDAPRTFLQALREKYMPEDAGTGGEIVYFSSKKAEEIGFEKFAKRQAQLQGIHTIVLDHMRIRHTTDSAEDQTIQQTCGHVTELDLSGNLFESLEEILSLAALFPKLSVLTLDSNRFTHKPGTTSTASIQIPGVGTLSLANTFMSWSDVALACQSFPSTTSLSAAHNGLTMLNAEQLPQSLKQLNLAENDFTSLSMLRDLASCTSLETVVLKRCRIKDVYGQSSPSMVPVNDIVRSIDLTGNHISSWSFFNDINTAFPALRHLHVGGNTLYSDLKSAEGKPLRTEDGYMLTIARLPHIETLNYSKVTEKERLNADTYYLAQIAVELSSVTNEAESKILDDHPRWKDLCEEYGEPVINRGTKTMELDPNSLAARLVNFTFKSVSPPGAKGHFEPWREEIPKSFNIYALLGIAGKRLGVPPLMLRLIWETDEHDPSGRGDAYVGPEWWDSSDEEEATNAANGDSVAREVELVAGTRPIGTYIEGREARVRIETKA